MRRRAFTLVELLAVIAIILILISLLIPSVAAGLEKARSIGCRNNMKSLQMGFNLRTMDLNGVLASGDTSVSPIYGLPWAETSDFTSSNSVVWPYVLEKSVYACPSYPSPGRERLKRHYSVSGFINSQSALYGAPYSARSMSQVRQPAKTHVLIEEYDQRSQSPPVSWINPGAQGAFVVGYGTLPTHRNDWVDTPMFWHNMGAYFSYLDGHVDYHKWVGPRMRTVDIYTWRHGADGVNWPQSSAADEDDFAFITGGVTNGYVK
jgi:prepilin-type N-terminal cleavage/methylation domain-containing protein